MHLQKYVLLYIFNVSMRFNAPLSCTLVLLSKGANKNILPLILWLILLQTENNEAERDAIWMEKESPELWRISLQILKQNEIINKTHTTPSLVQILWLKFYIPEILTMVMGITCTNNQKCSLSPSFLSPKK